MRIKLSGLLLVAVTFCALIGGGQDRRPRLPETPPPTIPPYVGLGTLKGKVGYASSVSPLPRAFVYVHSESGWGGDKIPRLDEKGKFEISLPGGLYDVFVAAGGFIPTCKVIEVGGGTTTEFNPKLHYDFEHSNPN
jgi:hypothetical protein